MVIQFGGLATGLDTSAIIKALMDVEREPLTRMENEKKYLSSRLEAFSQFESKLSALADSIAEMNTSDKLGSYRHPSRIGRILCPDPFQVPRRHPRATSRWKSSIWPRCKKTSAVAMQTAMRPFFPGEPSPSTVSALQ